MAFTNVHAQRWHPARSPSYALIGHWEQDHSRITRLTFTSLFGKILSELAIDRQTFHSISAFSVARPAVADPNYQVSFQHYGDWDAMQENVAPKNIALHL